MKRRIEECSTSVRKQRSFLTPQPGDGAWRRLEGSLVSMVRNEAEWMSTWMFIVLAVGSAATPPATIYRCPGDDGETMFSDRPCAGGEPQPVKPLITLDMAHFSDDEKATLDRLRRSETTTPAAVQQPRANAKSPDQRRCDAARDGLERVRATKRRGYRAASAAALDAREREYENRRDRDCRP
jgi:hypothetical protein